MTFLCNACRIFAEFSYDILHAIPLTAITHLGNRQLISRIPVTFSNNLSFSSKLSLSAFLLNAIIDLAPDGGEADPPPATGANPLVLLEWEHYFQSNSIHCPLKPAQFSALNLPFPNSSAEAFSSFIGLQFTAFIVRKIRKRLMKYRDLKITFSIENIDFTILSICLEKLVRPIPKHSHSRSSYELHYISYGYGTLIAQGQKYTITPGSLFMTGPGVAHEQISTPQDPMTEYCVYFQIEKDIESTTGIMNTFLEHDFWIGMAESSIHELMKQIFLELESQPAGYELMLPSLLQQLILLLTRHYKQGDTLPVSDTPKSTNVNDLTYLIIEEAFLYDYRDLTLDTLARQVKLGKRQTERLLKKHYNKTFLQKRTEARMSAACILLQDSKKGIAAIAEELGYSSAEHFTNAFKTIYNMTPSAFRRNKRT